MRYMSIKREKNCAKQIEKRFSEWAFSSRPLVEFSQPRIIVVYKVSASFAALWRSTLVIYCIFVNSVAICGTDLLMAYLLNIFTAALNEYSEINSF